MHNSQTKRHMVITESRVLAFVSPHRWDDHELRISQRLNFVLTVFRLL